MTENLFAIQPPSNQQDTVIAQNDSLENNTVSKLLNLNKKKTAEKDSIVKLIEQGYDATSFFYVTWEKDATPTNTFLNPAIFKKAKTFKEQVTPDNLTNNNQQMPFKEADILLLVLLMLVSLVAYVRISTKDYIKKITASVFNFAYLRTLFNERTKLMWIKDAILLLIFYVSAGILTDSLVKTLGFSFPETDINIAISTTVIIFLLIFFYQLIVRILGYLSFTSRIVAEYLFYFNNLLKFLGIFNLIILFALIFGPEYSKIYLAYIIFFTYIIIYTLRVYKIFSDFLVNRFSLFYFILYFCALEIVPIMMLIKLFSTITGTKFDV